MNHRMGDCGSAPCEMCKNTLIVKYAKLIGRIRSLILRETDVRSALAIARLYGGIRRLNFDGVYEDEELERHLTDRVMGCVDDLAALHKDGMRKGVVCIASELHEHGGHSAVVKKWLGFQDPTFQHTLVVTRKVTRNYAERIRHTGTELIECGGDAISVIRQILNAGADAQIIVLFIHPDDIAAAIAARILKMAGRTCYFYNHSDHTFTYGIGAADVVCEISDFGRSISDRSGRVRGQSVHLGIPLTVNTERSAPIKVPTNIDRPRILTCGDAYKYKPENGYFFGDFIDDLLRLVPQAEITFIGPTGHEPWWQERRGAWGRHVRFMGLLSSTEYEKVLEETDVYVDSYPVTGGTAFPEALLRGKACAALKIPCQGYSRADQLRVDTPLQMAHRAMAILHCERTEFERLEKVRMEVISLQSDDAFKSRLGRLYKHDLPGEEGNRVSALAAAEDLWFEKVWLNRKVILLPYLQKTCADEMRLISRIGLLVAFISTCACYESLRAYASLLCTLINCKRSVKNNA